VYKPFLVSSIKSPVWWKDEARAIPEPQHAERPHDQREEKVSHEKAHRDIIRIQIAPSKIQLHPQSVILP